MFEGRHQVRLCLGWIWLGQVKFKGSLALTGTHYTSVGHPAALSQSLGLRPSEATGYDLQRSTHCSVFPNGVCRAMSMSPDFNHLYGSTGKMMKVPGSPPCAGREKRNVTEKSKSYGQIAANGRVMAKTVALHSQHNTALCRGFVTFSGSSGVGPGTLTS